MRCFNSGTSSELRLTCARTAGSRQSGLHAVFGKFLVRLRRAWSQGQTSSRSADSKATSTPLSVLRRLFTQSKDFQHAEALCREHQSHLASFSSGDGTDEFDSLLPYLPLLSGASSAWIGARDTSDTNAFEFTDKSGVLALDSFTSPPSAGNSVRPACSSPPSPRLAPRTDHATFVTGALCGLANRSHQYLGVRLCG